MFRLDTTVANAWMVARSCAPTDDNISPGQIRPTINNKPSFLLKVTSLELRFSAFLKHLNCKGNAASGLHQ